MATEKVIGRVEVSIGNVKFVDVNGVTREPDFEGLMYEGEQIYSDDPNALFQIKYLALPEATAYDGIFRVLADGSVITGLEGNENMFGDDIDFMETAAGDAGPTGSSAFLEEVPVDESSLLGFGRGSDLYIYGEGVVGVSELYDDGDRSAPVITSGSNVVFDENSTEAVLQVTASDTSSITFSISGLDSSLFSINPTTGVLTFNDSPDYENPLDSGGDNEYNVNVTATDIYGNSTTQLLSIYVNNLNDNAPTAEDDAQSATEDVYGDVTGQLVGSDADGNEIRYELGEDTLGEDEGSLIFNSDGSYTYSVDGDFQDLALGETRDVTFTYRTVEVGPPLSEPSDAGPFASEEATVTITVTGTNDQPVVTNINANGGSGSVVETGEDFSEAHDITVSGDGSIGYSYFTVHEITTVTITTDGPTIDPQLYLFRGDGSLSIDDFITSNDDGWTPAGAFSNSIITITLLPGNYIAAVSDFHLTAQEVVDGFNTNSMIGTVTLNFTANHPISLNDSNVNTVFYESHDDIDIPGEDDTQADINTIFVGIIDTVMDADITDEHTYEMVDGSLLVNGEDAGDITASIALNGSTWEYTVEGDVNFLAAGETAVVTFDYVAIDDSGVGAGSGANEPDTSEPATITLTITGTNDQPIVSAVVVEAIDEAASGLNLNVFTNELSVIDDDASDTHTFHLVGEDGIAQANVMDNSGDNLGITASVHMLDDVLGKFQLVGDFNGLDDGESATVTFYYYAVDNNAIGEDGVNESSYSEPKMITLTVLGADDAPTLAAVTSGSITEIDQSASTTDVGLSGTLVGADVDVETLT
uniref:VCBS domain-containing protein n=1 Tax=Sulfurimonas sp. TaxID=2022749 RepID=UPI003564D79A